MEQHQGLKVRISFVAYRDICDGKLNYEIKEFTEDIDSMKKFIGGLLATGGGDQCEDVAGGLTYALQQNWKAKAKYAVFIADSPAHGKNYHVNCLDDYPQGDPKGRKIEDLIAQFAKNDINLYAIKITDSTDKMFAVMGDVYSKIGGKKLQIAALGSSTKCFGFFITCTINSTITQTALKDNIVALNDFMTKLKNRPVNTVMEIEEFKKEAEEQKVQKKVLDLEFSFVPCNWSKGDFTQLLKPFATPGLSLKINM
jgi:vacuole morphology and inheritance protein 14